MSSFVSDPLGSTTNVLTLFSFTIGTIGFGAAYTSACATSFRYNAVLKVLCSWEDYVQNLTTQEIAHFERSSPGELDRMKRDIAQLRSRASAMNVELCNHSWWLRYFPGSDVCTQFRAWDGNIQKRNKDFYTSTEAVRRTQRFAIDQGAQTQPGLPMAAPTQGVPPIDRNRALQWLTVMRTRVPRTLQGIMDGLSDIVVSQLFDRGT